jgi:uncharacterized protein (DUF488 family)
MSRIYTFGYLQRDVAELRDLADALDAIVIDVRESPQSRTEEWSGWSLKRALGERYLHVRGFGNLNYNNDGPIVLRDPEAGLSAVAPIIATKSVILLCMCPNAATCHRNVVAQTIAADTGLCVEHLQSGEPDIQGTLF